MSDGRQKNQLVLAFDEEYRGEAPNGLAGGTESLAAKRGTESRAIGEQLMEEALKRGSRCIWGDLVKCYVAQPNGFQTLDNFVTTNTY